MLAFICIYESKINFSNLFLITAQGFTMCFYVILSAETQDHVVVFWLLNKERSTFKICVSDFYTYKVFVFNYLGV